MLGEQPGENEDPEERLLQISGSEALVATHRDRRGRTDRQFSPRCSCLSALFIGTQTFSDTKLGVVSRTGAAYEAGIRPGDKITHINGTATQVWEDIGEGIGGRPESGSP